METGNLLSFLDTQLKENPTLFGFLLLLGIYSLTRWVFWIWRFVWVYFLRPRKSFAKYQGTWAVITGASWGIGYGFCKQLAKSGLSIVLIARSQERLEEVAKELETKYKVQTRIIVVDFDAPSPDYSTIASQLKGLNITFLVNNVGIAPPYLKYFHEHTVEELESIVHVNVDSMNRMTHVVLPGMLERKAGVIIMLSSLSGMSSTKSLAYFSVYSGTKAYANRLAKSLNEEYSSHGIEVLSITPGFVTSKMTGVKKARFGICDEDKLASDTLDHIGYHDSSTIPWVGHKISHLYFRSSNPLFLIWNRRVAEKVKMAGKKRHDEKTSQKKSQ